jgi:hypothetical protein
MQERNGFVVYERVKRFGNDRIVVLILETTNQ